MSGESKGTTVRLDIPAIRFSFSGSSNSSRVIKSIVKEEDEEMESKSALDVHPPDAPGPPSTAPTKRKYTKFRSETRRRSSRLIAPPKPKQPKIEIVPNVKPVKPLRISPAAAASSVNTSLATVFVGNFSCAICRTSDHNEGYSEIRRTTLLTLCAHLNILDQYYTDQTSNDDEFERFPLCAKCHELAANVAALNAQLETIYLQISGLLDNIKTAVSNTYKLDEVGSCPDGDDNGQRFRSLVLQNAGFITTSEISVEMGPGQEDDKEDQEVISFDLAGLEEKYGARDLDEGCKNLSEDSSRGDRGIRSSVSPSPAFSPLSCDNEDLNSISSTNCAQSKVTFQKQQISKKRTGRPRKNPPGTQVNKISHGAAKSKVKIPLSVPREDHATYQVLRSLGIQYRRLEVKLHKLKITGNYVTCFDRGHPVKHKVSSSTLNPWKELEDRSGSAARIYDVLTIDSGEEDSAQDCKEHVSVPDVSKPTILSIKSLRVPTSTKALLDTQNNKLENLKLISRREILKKQVTPQLQQKTMSHQHIKSPKLPLQLPSSSKLNESSSPAAPIHAVSPVNNTQIKKVTYRIPVRQTATGSLICRFCDKEYPSFSEFTIHVRAEHQNRCEISSQVTKTKKQLKRFYGKTEIKVLENGSFKFKCGACGELSLNEKAIINHIKLAHKEKSNNSTSSSTVISKEKLSSLLKTVVMKNGRLYYGGHEIIKTKDDNFECSVCKKVFSTMLSIQNHMRLIHNNDAIKKGSINFKPKNSLFKIINTEKGYKTYGSFPFHETKEGLCRCLSSTCKGKWFQSQDQILRHIREAHLKLYPDSQNRTSAKIRIKSIKHDDGRVFHRGTEMIKTEDGKHQCGNCLQVLSSVSNLMVHIAKRHNTPQNPFICQYCGKKFAYKFILKKHEEAHESDPSLMCEKCGKAFRFQSNLTHHIREFHNNETRFTCRVCGKKFYGKGDYIRHKETHPSSNAEKQKNTSKDQSTPQDEVTFLCSVPKDSSQNSPISPIKSEKVSPLTPTTISLPIEVISKVPSIYPEEASKTNLPNIMSICSSTDSLPPTLIRFDEDPDPEPASENLSESTDLSEPPQLFPCS